MKVDHKTLDQFSRVEGGVVDAYLRAKTYPVTDENRAALIRSYKADAARFRADRGQRPQVSVVVDCSKGIDEN